MVVVGMLREWSDGSGACGMHAWGTMRVLRRVIEGDGQTRGVELLRTMWMLLSRIKAWCPWERLTPFCALIPC